MMMNLSEHAVNGDHMKNAVRPVIANIHYPPNTRSNSAHSCAICGSKSIGMNFGVLTCAPCKAFFRRNARRRELLELPCRHRDLSLLMINHIGFNERTARYLQIRRCSSCRLRRCFEMGMREELVRSDAENERHRQLVDINRTQRELLKQQLLEIQQVSIPPFVLNNKELSEAIDWRHLSNIVYAYDTCCLKTFTQQRAEMLFNKTSQTTDEQSSNSLPAFYSLPRRAQNYLCKTNIRPLMFPNIHELNQSCFSEPWQTAAYKSTWELICGSQLYQQFVQAERLAENLWVTDPIVIRLWVITLFFSTPLHYHDDCPTSTPILKNKLPIQQAQNAYVTLLWNYLLHRYGDAESVRIYSNLVCVYMKMQTVGFGIYLQLRTKQELRSTDETLSKLVTLNIHEDQRRTTDINDF